MANYKGVSAKDCGISLVIAGKTIKIDGSTEFSWKGSKTIEEMLGIGSKDPIGLGDIATNKEGSITIYEEQADRIRRFAGVPVLLYDLPECIMIITIEKGTGDDKYRNTLTLTGVRFQNDGQSFSTGENFAKQQIDFKFIGLTII